ncbi:DUF1028 domain-containing protein [Geodermatophilus sp. DSM 44513]|uniref:DUF1028 domain-containing protein n=1 Tax=Geodermatophilus sp. DSM 44513 TaxID=1528104 RepID=UPI0012796D91|nr:DUF1028 domain-containing protein [Geodermatophilus sp. DSM 44513]WNV77033.1 DUF1028 domain-containing protein [Geodermatophilus sp. DSM 44513]
MTFSLVGRSPDGSALGVAVASKFLAAGAYVPAAAADAGALATQAHVNLELKTRGLAMLREGVAAGELLQRFFDADPDRAERQAGVVDRDGRAATFTGERAQHWAGGRTGEGPEGSFAAQGNLLAGPGVVDAMVDAWLASAAEPDLARRLVAALAAGQDAGGDPRGKQAAAVLVVSAGGGYGGLGDVVVDLRSDDHPEPIGELTRMLDLHDLYFGSTPAEQLLAHTPELDGELVRRLAATGYASGDLGRDLYDWMGRENFEERWHDDRIDPVVLEHLRRTTG